MLEINFVLIYFFGKNFHNFFYTKYYNISQSTAWKTNKEGRIFFKEITFCYIIQNIFSQNGLQTASVFGGAGEGDPTDKGELESLPEL